MSRCLLTSFPQVSHLPVRTIPLGLRSRIFSGGTPDKSRLEFWEGGSLPWIGSGEVNQFLVQTATAYITPEAVSNSSTKLMPRGSVIIALAGQGKTKAMTAQMGIDAYGNQSLACIVDFKGHNRYLLWWLTALYREIRGLSSEDTRDGLNQAIIGQLPVPDFDVSTQKRIADFLDRETSRIDELITKKVRATQVLGEKRKVVALQCLSAGLESFHWSSEKQSFVIRLKHPDWAQRRVKTVVSFMTSGSRGWSDLLGSDGELFIQSGNIGRHMDVDLESAQRVAPQSGAEAERTLVLKHDVLVCITGGRTGAVGYVSGIDERAYINQHICLLRARRDSILPKLLAHLLWSEIGQKQIEMCQYGVKQGLGFSQVAELTLPLPPLDQQSRITAEIDRILGGIDAATSNVERSISSLREFRSALITGAVTGQIDAETWRRRRITERRMEAIQKQVST